MTGLSGVSCDAFRLDNVSLDMINEKTQRVTESHPDETVEGSRYFCTYKVRLPGFKEQGFQKFLLFKETINIKHIEIFSCWVFIRGCFHSDDLAILDSHQVSEKSSNQAALVYSASANI